MFQVDVCETTVASVPDNFKLRLCWTENS